MCVGCVKAGGRAVSGQPHALHCLDHFRRKGLIERPCLKANMITKLNEVGGRAQSGLISSPPLSVTAPLILSEGIIKEERHSCSIINIVWFYKKSFCAIRVGGRDVQMGKLAERRRGGCMYSYQTRGRGRR